MSSLGYIARNGDNFRESRRGRNRRSKQTVQQNVSGDSLEALRADIYEGMSEMQRTVQHLSAQVVRLNDIITRQADSSDDESPLVHPAELDAVQQTHSTQVQQLARDLYDTEKEVAVSADGLELAVTEVEVGPSTTETEEDTHEVADAPPPTPPRPPPLPPLPPPQMSGNAAPEASSPPEIRVTGATLEDIPEAEAVRPSDRGDIMAELLAAIHTRRTD